MSEISFLSEFVEMSMGQMIYGSSGILGTCQKEIILYWQNP